MPADTPMVLVPRATVQKLSEVVPPGSGLYLHLRSMLSASPAIEGDHGSFRPSASIPTENADKPAGQWQPIETYSGCAGVLVATKPESEKYLYYGPFAAFKDVGGTWRCLGSVGGNAPLGLEPTHWRPLPPAPSSESDQ